NVERLLQLGQASLALFERALVIALLGEAAVRVLAALSQRRVDVAPEQRRDVHLHLLAFEVGRVDFVAVDRSGFIFRKENRDLRALARAGGAIGLAVA